MKEEITRQMMTRRRSKVPVCMRTTVTENKVN